MEHLGASPLELETNDTLKHLEKATAAAAETKQHQAIAAATEATETAALLNAVTQLISKDNPLRVGTSHCNGNKAHRGRLQNLETTGQKLPIQMAAHIKH